MFRLMPCLLALGMAIAGSSFAAGSGKVEPSAVPAPNPQVEVVKKFIDALYNKGDFAKLGAMLDPAFLQQGGQPAESGVARIQTELLELRLAFPELKYEIEEAFSAGDRVVIRGYLSGVQKSVFYGLPPTMGLMNAGIIDIYTVRADRIINRWYQWDRFGAMTELGMPVGIPISPAPLTPIAAPAPLNGSGVQQDGKEASPPGITPKPPAKLREKR